MNAIPPSRVEREMLEIDAGEVEDLDNEPVQGEPEEEVLQMFGISLKKSADVKSKEEAVEETRKRAEVIAQILATQSPSDKSDRVSVVASSVVYRRIANSMNTWIRNWRKPAIEELCKTNFMETFYEIVAAVDYVNDLTGAINVWKVLTVFTDCSYNASKILCEKGTIPIVVNILNDEVIKTKLTDHRNEGRFASQSLCAFHNIAKVADCKTKFQEINAVEVLKFYLADDRSTEKMQMSALCALSYILSDKDASSLSDEYDIIPKLVNCLAKALKMKGRKAHFGFSAEEIVDSLSNLAVNDDNKIKLVKSGVLPLLERMLGLTTVHQDRAVSCLWRLAFSEDVRQLIIAEPNCLAQLEAIYSSPTATGTADDNDKQKDLQMKARNAVEFIRIGKGGLGGSSFARSQPPGGHIFISYSWKQQEVVIKIRDALVQRGFNVWIDVDEMHGSTLEAMASAVENAFVVIICYSEHYRTSNMCRTEAEYVFRLQKPFIPVNFQYHYQPDGWLGIIIGAKLYVDFSLERHSFEDTVPKLFKEISQFEDGGNQLTTTKPTSSSSSNKPTLITSNATTSSCAECKVLAEKVDRLCQLVEALSSSLLLQTNSPSGPESFGPMNNDKKKAISLEKVRKWLAVEIAVWLKSERLPNDLIHSLAGFDGPALVGLYEMKLTAPENYYKSVLQLCNNSFPLCIQFTVSLENLFSKIE